MKILLCAVLSVLSSAAIGRHYAVASHSYEIVLVDERWKDRPFLLEVAKDNFDGIKSLESYIGKEVRLDPQGNFQIGIANGKVLKTKRTPQHAWNYRIDPATVEFADATTEVCDASFMYIEQDVDNWIREVGTFCPWNTTLWVVSIKKVWTK